MSQKYLRVEMSDGSKWDVPVSVIAEDRAKYYAYEFDNDVERSMNEDTLPLFEDVYEIEDWAANNMNWTDVCGFAEMVSEGETDYQDGWVNGIKEVITK